MSTLDSIELKAFLPARDYALSRQFYQDLGFSTGWISEELTYFHHGDRCAFLLQKFYVKEFAENLMMHLLVEDVDSWWAKVQEADLAGRYGVRCGELQDQPWRMRDFTLNDPSGVLWRIAQNI
ncbi:Glyoxalase-like domain protein [compost metagenome]